MSLSLYRRWRPRSFDDLVGQDAVVRTLRAALSSGKLAHAYLFSGPRGSGKTSAAKILARCIDCELGPTPDPDNTCDNCRAIFAGSALDVQEVDAASNRGIEEIRALRESVKFAPASMRYKVFIIDEAHMLTREGANAFLKTLEEPPPHAVFILATTAPEALPPTILSRCQRYAFRRIAIPTMIERMRQIAKAEGLAIGDDALGALAYRADGGLRDALTMLEQVAAFAGGGPGPIDAAAVEAAFGSTGRVYARALVTALREGDAPAALRLVDEASDAGTDMQGLIRTTVGEFRNLLVARVDPDLLSADLAPEDAAATRAAALATSQVRIVRALRLLADALAAGRISGNPRLELETAALRFIFQSEDPGLEALSARLAQLEARLAGDGAPVPAPPVVGAEKAVPAAPPKAQRTAPAPLPEAEPAAPVAPVPSAPPEAPAAAGVTGRPTLQQIRSLWDQIRTRAYERSKPLRTQLNQAAVEALEGNLVTLRFVDAMHADMARAKTAIVEEALSEVVGMPMRVAFQSGGTPPGRPVQTKAEAPAANAAPPSASAAALDGEGDLMAYARMRFSEAPTGTETR